MDVEQFLLFEILVALIVGILMFFLFYQTFAAVFPVGCNNNGLIENQFSQAEFGTPNRMEGTPLFRCYGTDACYQNSTANQTCITNWCYYTLWKNGQGSVSAVQACISDPSAYPTVLLNCKSISPQNTAALQSCAQINPSVIANNATTIESCNTNIPTCIQGDDAAWCAPCVGQ